MIKSMTAPENVWAIKVSGDLSVDEVRVMYDKLEEMLKTHKTVGLVVDLAEFEDASREAIDADVKREIALLKHISQFKRMAMVTDRKWLSYLVERMNAIFPMVTLRTFAPGQSKAAIDWAAAA